MDEAVEYILLRIEQSYYNKNPYLFEMDYCMKEEGLPCNCITGIILNYAGYVAKKCWRDSNCDSFMEVNKDTAYIRTTYQHKDLCPVCWKDNMLHEFCLFNKTCMKNRVIDAEIYFPFRNYRDENELDSKIINNKFSHQVLSNADKFKLEFWILFLGAIRVKTLEIKQKALLCMAIFLFPESTLKMMHQVIRAGTLEVAEVQFLKEFISEYRTFIGNMRNCKQSNFCFHFASEFEKLTDVNVASFIEDINEKTSDMSLFQILWAAYRRNCEQLDRRSGYFGKIEKAVA